MRVTLQALAFVIVTTLLSLTVAAALAGGTAGPKTTYAAILLDASGLKVGDEVRAAGVDVGTVQSLALRDDNTVRVSFSAADDVPISATTEVQIRWADLTGHRYLDLTDAGHGTRLESGATIPEDHTEPAVDLDAVFSGFTPLLEALSPSDVNQLTANIIAVSQGESGAVTGLLNHVASLTSSLADHDQLIESTITNLDTVLDTVDQHQGDFNRLVVGLAALVHRLSADRADLVGSLARISTFAGSAADLLRSVRFYLPTTLRLSDRIARTVDANAATVDQALAELPQALRMLSRGGAYGGFFNFYLCGVRIKYSDSLGHATFTPWTLSREARCTS